jgi:YbbR domain-containing protein
MKREDALLLIASLIVALALMMQVQPLFEPGREREFIAPLFIESKPNELAVFPSADYVTVVASGTQAALDKLDITKVSAYLDLSKGKAGQMTVAVQIRGPADLGLDFRAKNPGVKVTCEQITRQISKITTIQTGIPEEGLVVETTVVSPTEVELFGPKSAMSRVAGARVTVDVARLKPGVNVSTAVEAIDKSGHPIPAVMSSPAKVNVAASFRAAQVEREVPVLATLTGTLPAGFKIVDVVVEPPRIKLTGPPEQIAQAPTISTINLPITGLKQSERLNLQLTVPKGLASSVNTVAVTVIIAKN